LAKSDVRRKAEKLRLDRLRSHVLVCTSGSCAGKGEQRRALKEARREAKRLGLQRPDERVLFSAVNCLGVCRAGPIAVVWPDGVFYRKADAKNLGRILREHVAGRRVVEDLCIARPHPDGVDPEQGPDGRRPEGFSPTRS
jgi:(2Fe-2S) ferredoxin